MRSVILLKIVGRSCLMWRVELSGLKARRRAPRLLVQQARREALAFRDSFDLEGSLMRLPRDRVVYHVKPREDSVDYRP